MIWIYTTIGIIGTVLLLAHHRYGRKFLRKFGNLTLILGELLILFYLFIATYIFFYAELPTSSYNKWLVPILGFFTIFILIILAGNLFIKQTKEKIQKGQHGYFWILLILLFITTFVW